MSAPAKKTKAPEYEVTSVSLPADLIDDVDARARELLRNRSNYLLWLIKEDLKRAGQPVEAPKPEGACA